MFKYEWVLSLNMHKVKSVFLFVFVVRVTVVCVLRSWGAVAWQCCTQRATRIGRTKGFSGSQHCRRQKETAASRGWDSEVQQQQHFRCLSFLALLQWSLLYLEWCSSLIQWLKFQCISWNVFGSLRVLSYCEWCHLSDVCVSHVFHICCTCYADCWTRRRARCWTTSTCWSLCKHRRRHRRTSRNSWTLLRKRKSRSMLLERQAHYFLLASIYL